MRTIIDVPKRDIEALDRLAKDQGKSRTALIRDAITDLLARTTQDQGDIAQFAGIWADRPIDGLSYQEALRSEW